MMRGARWLYIVLTLLPMAIHAAGDIYYFVDEGGTTHYSNVPTDTRYAVFLEAAKQPTEAGERITASSMAAAASRYASLIEKEARENNVNPALVYAVIAVESGYNASAVSRAGARGLMQLMPHTARQYGVRDIFDPAENIRAGTRLLADLSKRYNHDLKLVLAAYNAGEAAVAKYGQRIPPFLETRRYVPRVLDIYQRLRTSRT
jgi:soluble lytic murein transglycosylase-like protein